MTLDDPAVDEPAVDPRSRPVAVGALIVGATLIGVTFGVRKGSAAFYLAGFALMIALFPR